MPEPAPAGSVAAASSAAPSAQAPAESRTVEPPRLPIEFVPVTRAATPGAVPQVEVQSPVLGKHIALAQAETYPVRLKASSWSKGHSVVMLLDDYPPRVFEDPQRPIALAQLWPAHRDLEPGLHRLFVTVQLPDGTTIESEPGVARASFAYLPFWVGPGDAAAEAEAIGEASDPGVILLTPRGTFNGNAAADQVLLDYQVVGLALGAAPPQVRVEVIVERQTYVTELGASDVRRIAGLPSGDHVVRVSLLGADGQPSNARYASASRVITVNRDAPVQ